MIHAIIGIAGDEDVQEVMMEAVSVEKIVDEFGSFVRYGVEESLDLYTLETFLKLHYLPSEDPWAMCVGVLGIKEATVLRKFHSKCYDLPEDRVKVVACNTRNNLDRLPGLDNYDVLLSGFMGDATQDYTWCAPFAEVTEQRSQYDITYIRNPDFVGDRWGFIFARALEYTRPEGAVVTIIREEDTKKYLAFLNQLKDSFGIEPVLSEQTGIDMGGLSWDFHHIVGIFKPKQ